jgi:peptidoglycan/xylan/chitin deacetylase (PgdA/CDA1 family)
MDKKLIALSFDDGPTETTTLVLDKLEKYNIVASFFLVGQNVTNEMKSVMERELSLGCEIDNHSWSHSPMNEMLSADIINEVKETSEVIHKMVGVRPKFFRPPYIATNDTLYEAVDIPFICGIGCNDWEPSVSAQERAEIILNKAKDGDIILMHDLSGNIQTVDALDAIIKGLLDKGFTFVTVSQLFEQKGINPNVRYKLWSNVTD